MSRFDSLRPRWKRRHESLAEAAMDKMATAEMAIAWVQLFQIAEGMFKSGESPGVIAAFTSLLEAMEEAAATAQRVRAGAVYAEALRAARGDGDGDDATG